MAQFTKGAPSVQPTGTGGQQIVQTPQPSLGKTLESVASTVSGAVNTAGKIWSEDKAKELVKQSISDVDAAVAVAQKRAKLPEDIANPNVPDSVKVSGAQFRMIENAMRTGGLSREKAQLLVSSKLRDAISQEPMYANQLRKDASSVLGFNITSLPAQQYFNAFKTSAQMAAESKNSIQAKWMQEAQAVVAGTKGISLDEAYQNIAEAHYLHLEKQKLSDMADMKAAHADDLASKWMAVDSSHGIQDFMQAVGTAVNNDGKPVDSVELNKKIELAKQNALDSFTNFYRNAGGVVGSDAYKSMHDQIKSRYEGYEKFATQLGVDNMQKIKLQRIKNAYDLLGNKLFPQMEFAIHTFGQQAGSDLMDLLARASTPAQRELLLSNRPTLKAMYDTLGKNNKDFVDLLNSTAQNVMSGKPLTEQQKQIGDAVTHEIYSKGSADTKGHLIQSLSKKGQNSKGISLLAQTSPLLVKDKGKFNIEYYKRQYKEQQDQKIPQLAESLAINPDMDWSIDDKGMIHVQPKQQGPIKLKAGQVGTTPAGDARTNSIEYQRAKTLADQLNQFAIGFSHGWGSVVGEGVSEYRAKLESRMQNAVTNAKSSVANQELKQMLGYWQAGQKDQAGKIFDKLKKASPSVYTRDLDWYLQKAREQLGVQ